MIIKIALKAIYAPIDTYEVFMVADQGIGKSACL